MKRLLRGGTLVRPDGCLRADLLMDGETISAIAEHLPDDGCEVIDVSGKLLFPGFVDAHTHFDLDVCNTTTADDFSSGTKCALLGGTTTIIDFACPEKGQTLQYGLDLWHRKADGRSSCDYGFHMTVNDFSEQNRRQLSSMFTQGVCSFKMYLTYPAMMLPDAELYEALLAIKALGGIAGVHCENAGVIDARIAQHKKAGRLSPAAHPECRPSALEAEAVSHLLRIAEVADCPVVIVHLSAKESLEEVKRARARGQTVFVETCPQYLLLDESFYHNPDFDKAAAFVCAPPLRKAADRAALWQALADGSVQTVCTDHCSFTAAQKRAGKGDFTKIPGGLPGVQDRALLLYTYGVKTGKITPGQMCALLAENPARLYGAYPRKGTLSVGSDADVVVLSDAERVFSAETELTKAGYTPYESMACKAKIDMVFLRGALACADGKILLENRGVYVPRARGKK